MLREWTDAMQKCTLRVVGVAVQQALQPTPYTWGMSPSEGALRVIIHTHDSRLERGKKLDSWCRSTGINERAATYPYQVSTEDDRPPLAKADEHTCVSRPELCAALEQTTVRCRA